MDDLETMFSLNNWPGHLSYVLMAVSYWLTNMFWLRVVAVIGLSLRSFTSGCQVVICAPVSDGT